MVDVLTDNLVPKAEIEPVLPPTTKEVVYQTVIGIVSAHPDKFAATIVPIRLTATTRFPGFHLEVSLERGEKTTSNRLDLNGDNKSCYRLNVTFGDEHTTIAKGLKDLFGSLGKPEAWRHTYTDTLGDTPANISDGWAEVTMTAAEALAVLQNAKDFVLPKIKGSVTLEELMRRNPKAAAMLLGKPNP